MKNILTIILFLSASFIYAVDTDSLLNKVSEIQESVVNYTNDLDTSQVSHQMYSDIKAGLTTMASALSTTADNLWDILVKQQLVKAIGCSLIVIAIIFSLICLFRNISKADYDSDSWNRNATFSILNIVFLIVSSIIFIFTKDIILTGFINPEYGALTDIITFVSAIKH